MNTEEYVREKLFEMQDLGYRDFQSRLMPNIDIENIIGVRTPALRKFAKEFAKTPEALEFIKLLPHRYYEENKLHGFIIETIKDYELCVSSVDAFLPYVDNWATCDLMSPKVFAKNKEKLFVKIKEWLASEKTYTIRFGTEMLMSHFLDGDFTPECLEMAAKVRSEEYYVNMMTAWFFATALAKQYDAALPYITEKRLPVWVHNKTIQKAVESYRITDEQKVFLKQLKIKEK